MANPVSGTVNEALILRNSNQRLNKIPSYAFYQLYPLVIKPWLFGSGEEVSSTTFPCFFLYSLTGSLS